MTVDDLDGNHLYGAVCDVVARVMMAADGLDLGQYDEPTALYTSNEARAAANRIMDLIREAFEAPE